MSLKLIPVEHSADANSKGHKQKQTNDYPFLKMIAMKFANLADRGGGATIEQIDDLIHGLQRCILRLQKEKTKRLKKKWGS